MVCLGTFVFSTITATGSPCLAFFNSDEAMVEFTRRAGGPKTLENPNIFDMIMERGFGEITLELSDEQYAKLKYGLSRG
jgi:hypothetical protein